MAGSDWPTSAIRVKSTDKKLTGVFSTPMERGSIREVSSVAEDFADFPEFSDTVSAFADLANETVEEKGDKLVQDMRTNEQTPLSVNAPVLVNLDFFDDFEDASITVVT